MNKKSNCIECMNKCNYYERLEKYVCIKCRNLDTYMLITRTKTKEIYMLKDDELTNLTYYIGRTRYGEARYYIKADIEKYLCVKYNITYNIPNTDLYSEIDRLKKNKEETRKEKYEKALERRNIKKEARKNKLITELSKYKLRLRNDSMLCKQYIEGNCEYSLKDVVQRMCEMKYLYEYCHMKESYSVAYEEQQEELRAGYFPDCSISEQAEDISLRKYSNGKYPKVFPWLE
jgi:hypothetical protein